MPSNNDMLRERGETVWIGAIGGHIPDVQAECFATANCVCLIETSSVPDARLAVLPVSMNSATRSVSQSV